MPLFWALVSNVCSREEALGESVRVGGLLRWDSSLFGMCRPASSLDKLCHRRGGDIRHLVILSLPATYQEVYFRV